MDRIISRYFCLLPWAPKSSQETFFDLFSSLQINPIPLCPLPLLPTTCAQQVTITTQKFQFPKCTWIWDIEIHSDDPLLDITLKLPNYEYSIPSFLMRNGKLPRSLLGSEQNPVVDAILETTIPITITFRSQSMSGKALYWSSFPIQSFPSQPLYQGRTVLKVNHVISGLVFCGEMERIVLHWMGTPQPLSLSRMRKDANKRGWGNVHYHPIPYWLDVSNIDLTCDITSANYFAPIRVYFIQEWVAGTHPYMQGHCFDSPRFWTNSRR